MAVDKQRAWMNACLAHPGPTSFSNKPDFCAIILFSVCSIGVTRILVFVIKVLHS